MLEAYMFFIVKPSIRYRSLKSRSICTSFSDAAWFSADLAYVAHEHVVKFYLVCLLSACSIIHSLLFLFHYRFPTLFFAPKGSKHNPKKYEVMHCIMYAIERL